MLRTLNSFAVDLIQIRSEDDLFWHVAQNVVGRLNFVDCVIYQVDQTQTCLRQVAAWGDKNPFGRSIINPLIIPFGKGITGRVAQSGKPVIVDDLLRSQNYIPDTQPARSEICVPLLSRGRVVGVIDSEHPDPGAFGEAELGLLTTVAAMTSAKLDLLGEARRSAERYRDLVASHAQLTEEIAMRKALEARLFEARRMESIGKLTGRLAHEFNNLLTVILGNLDFLEFDRTGPNADRSLYDARTAAERGARLMRDMLAFAQKSRLNPIRLDLNAEVAAFQAGQPHSVAQRLDLSLAQGLWPIAADAAAIESVLLNLVENALDAMPEGGQVRITTENLLHNMADSMGQGMDILPGRHVRLTLSDSGVGIPADRLGQIFDPFFTSKPVGAGTGLGLSIVRGFTQQLGGTVTVMSEPGKGTSFQLTFPAIS
ncbi:ATP-binding protein [Gemmobacter denitrificans]|uniref:histidine kinase n=1 Tax=Gemmobacter denitrificans TaxID=3123040 RepID=A0ABU8BXD0_9RHOB